MWCAAGDPNTQSCPNNVSPYQEPDVPMKTGQWCILGIGVAAVIGYFIRRHKMAEKKAKNKRLFVKRIAKEAC